MGKMAKTDLTGMKFNRLTVLQKAGKNKHGMQLWLCQCDCGNKKELRCYDICNGAVKSCGCLQKEIQRNRITEANKHWKELYGERPKTHGMSKTRLFNIYWGMRHRYESEKHNRYKHYGGKGIRVCKEWQTFEPFMEWALNNGYAKNLSIDRINNDGNYEPSNCQWATIKEQANNKSQNRYITINDVTKNMTEWSKITGVPVSIISNRISRHGWDEARAVTEKVGAMGGDRRSNRKRAV